MKKIILIIIISINSALCFSLEVPWETLRTLEIDAKTKKQIIKPELAKVVGKEISMKGFMMPLDYEAKEIVEFLFMPYVPSCMHVPPPPTNQLVLVKMKKGAKIKPSFYPIELTGKLTIESNPELESSFKFEGTKVVELKQYNPPAGAPTGTHQP